jgi:hypothetical protein
VGAAAIISEWSKVSACCGCRRPRLPLRRADGSGLGGEAKAGGGGLSTRTSQLAGPCPAPRAPRAY